MTVAPATPQTTYALIGTSVGPFATVWPYENVSDVVVYLDLGGAPRLLSLGADYTLTAANSLQNGGGVLLNAGLPGAGWPASAGLLLERHSPNGQPLALGAVTSFSPDSVEDELDELARQIQDANAVLTRALTRFANGYQAGGRPILGVGASTDPGAAVNFAGLQAAVGGGGVAAIPQWMAILGVPAAVAALATATPATGKIFEFTGPTSGHLINTPTALVGAANVNDYLAAGDATYDGAFSRALAANNHVYVPAKAALGGGAYAVTAPIVLQSGQSIYGDGSGISVITSNAAAQPVISLGSQIYGFGLRGLTLTHSVTPVAGGDGVRQGQGPTDWINDGRMQDVICMSCYVGFNLGKAFYAEAVDCEAGPTCVREGFLFTTTGNSTVPSGANAGPLQWYLDGCTAGSNGYDSYAYHVTGTAFGGAGVGSSVGTLTNCTDFNSGHHSVAAYGSAAHPLNSIRIEGGFYGQAVGNGIYLDTYGRDHSIRPAFIELSGANNIQITVNNSDVLVALGTCSGAFWDGILSDCADLTVVGGMYVNNGVAGSGGVGNTWKGIHLNSGSASICGALFKDTGSGIQSYGISVVGDDVAISGCRFRGNAIAPIFWNTGPTNSVVAGCMPNTVNTGGVFTGGTITGNLIVTGDVRAGTLHVPGAAAFFGGVNVVSGGMAFTSGVVGNGLTVDNITTNFSLGVGAAASGVAGQLNFGTAIGSTSLVAPIVSSSSDLIANGNFHANGPSAFASGSTWTGSNSITVGGGVTAQDIQALRSMGVGSSSADGVTGHLGVGDAILIGAATGGFQSGTVNVPTNFKINNVAIGGGGGGNAFTGDVTITAGRLLVGGFVIASTTGVLASSGGLAINGAITGATNITASGAITAGTDLVTNGQFHCNGAAAFTSGGVNITAGGMNFTAGVAGNGLTVDNIQARVSAGVGSTGALTGVDGELHVGKAIGVSVAPHGGGVVDVSNAVELNGSPYTNP